MNTQEIKDAFRDIELALHITHNTVTTDSTDAQVDDFSWHIDNSKEIYLLSIIKGLFIKSIDTCPLCGGHKTSL